MKRIAISLLCAAASLFPAGRATANDSALAFGGSPGALTEHPSVTMRSEVVRMEVGEALVTVDCTFVFENHGPACTVRMGFPDEGRGAADPDEEGMQKKPQSTFNSFQSWVDGKPVQTKLIRAAQEGSFWHAKTVAFPANRPVVIRDRYTVDVGSSVAYNVPVRQTSYILYTGSSWHGNIGRSEVSVTFRGKGVRTPLLLKRTKWDPKTADRPYRLPNYAHEVSGSKPLVYYEGPCRPAVSGKTLTFVRTDWRPTPQDDITLVFDLGKPYQR